MTIHEVLAAVRRRWYVVTLGLVLTAVAVVVLHDATGVYYARSRAVFLAPTSTTNPNSLGVPSSSLTATAGVVERIVNGEHAPPKPTSPEVRLADTGVRDGWWVFLPNYGSQWEVDNRRSMLIVDVTGPSSTVVSERSTQLLDEIQTELATLQDGSDVSPVDRITVKSVPETPTVSYLAGKPSRAALMAGLLGSAISLMAAVLVDRRLRLRRR